MGRGLGVGGGEIAHCHRDGDHKGEARSDVDVAADQGEEASAGAHGRDTNSRRQSEPEGAAAPTLPGGEVLRAGMLGVLSDALRFLGEFATLGDFFSPIHGDYVEGAGGKRKLRGSCRTEESLTPRPVAPTTRCPAEQRPEAAAPGDGPERREHTMARTITTWDGVSPATPRRRRVLIGVIGKLPIPLAATLGAIFVALPVGGALVAANRTSDALLILAFTAAAGAVVGASLAYLAWMPVRAIPRSLDMPSRG